MNELLVLVGVITGCSTTDVVIPLAHGPSCYIVGVKRNGVGVVLDCLKGIHEFCRSLGNGSNACISEYLLIINNTLCGTGCGYTVNLTVGQPSGCVSYLLLHVFKRAVRNEVRRDFCHINGRNHHDVTPVTAGKSKQCILLIIGGSVYFYGNVRIHFIECLYVFAVRMSCCRLCIIKQVGSVAEPFNGCG